MITNDEVFQIGKINKPHGLQGELSFSFTSSVFDEVECPYLVCEVDGILVPFFIESYSFKNDDTALIKFEGIDTDEEAKVLSKADVFMSRSLVPDGADVACGIDFYIDYKVFDENDKVVGVIVGVDDTTENVLFLVESDGGQEYMIPASDEFVLEIDDEKHTMKMQIPEGLLSLD